MGENNTITKKCKEVSSNIDKECEITELIKDNKNIIHECSNWNKYVDKVTYIICPKDDKIVIAIFKHKNGNISTDCMCNLEKIDINSDYIIIDRLKKYYYKNCRIIFEVKRDTWENTVVILGDKFRKEIYGDRCADAPEEFLKQDIKNLAITAMKFIDKL